jgi:hypothetical protein
MIESQDTFVHYFPNNKPMSVSTRHFPLPNKQLQTHKQVLVMTYACPAWEFGANSNSWKAATAEKGFPHH